LKVSLEFIGRPAWWAYAFSGNHPLHYLANRLFIRTGNELESSGEPARMMRRGGDRLKGQLEMSWLAAGTHHHGWPTRATIDSDIPRQVLVARMNAYSQRVDLVTAETNTSTAYCPPTLPCILYNLYCTPFAVI